MIHPSLNKTEQIVDIYKTQYHIHHITYVVCVNREVLLIMDGWTLSINLFFAVFIWWTRKELKILSLIYRSSNYCVCVTEWMHNFDFTVVCEIALYAVCVLSLPLLSPRFWSRRGGIQPSKCSKLYEIWHYYSLSNIPAWICERHFSEIIALSVMSLTHHGRQSRMDYIFWVFYHYNLRTADLDISSR